MVKSWSISSVLVTTKRIVSPSPMRSALRWKAMSPASTLTVRVTSLALPGMPNDIADFSDWPCNPAAPAGFAAKTMIAAAAANTLSLSNVMFFLVLK
jgi:hypothetical protein